MRKLLKVLLPLVVLLAAGYGAKRMVDSRQDPEVRANPAPPPLVRVHDALAGEQTLQVMSQGTVMARTESKLLAQVSGRIEWVAPDFVAGGFFEKGDVLLRLDRRDHEFNVIRAEAAVARADRSVATEESEAAVALSEWETLGDGEAGPLVLRVPQLAEARAEAAAARAALAQARLDLERTEVKAHFAGRVRQTDVDVGQFVNANTPLAELYAIDRVEVRLPVPDDELAHLDLPMAFRGASAGQLGPPVELATQFAGRRWTWTGRIVRVEGEIDARTRMVHLVAMVEDPYAPAEEAGRPPLAVGMFVTARIEGRHVRSVIAMPREALREGGRVIVVDDEDRLRFRDVNVLRLESARVLIEGGLQSGDRVATSYLETAVEGMAVRVVRETTPDDELPIEPAGELAIDEAADG